MIDAFWPLVDLSPPSGKYPRNRASFTHARVVQLNADMTIHQLLDCRERHRNAR
jgi:hypothetical protein